MSQHKLDLGAEAAKAAPPLSVAGASLAGVTLNDVVLILTGIYVVMQIAFLAYKTWRLHTGKDRAED